MASGLRNVGDNSGPESIHARAGRVERGRGPAPGSKAVGPAARGQAYHGPMLAPYALLLLAAPAAAQLPHLWTVDDDGPADFAVIQDAIWAAGPTDHIVVQDGVYAGFEIVETRLTLEAAAGARVEIRGQVQVRDLHGSGWVFLRGLRTSDTPATAEETATFLAMNSIGPIWVEDCSFGAPLGASAALGAPSRFHGDAATVNQANVIFVRGELCGGSGVGGEPGGAGLVLAPSNAWVHGSRIAGGSGLAQGGPPASGGPGISQEGGFLFLGGSTVSGGDGASALDASCSDGGDGGDGLTLFGLFPVLESQDNALAGGAGGASLCGAPGAGGAPRAVLTPAGITDLAGASVAVVAASPLTDGDAQTLSVTGAPGDLVLLAFSFGHDTADIPGAAGWLLLFQPAELLTRTLLPASGSATLTQVLPGPHLSAHIEALTFYVQPIALRAGGELVYGSPTGFGILPAALRLLLGWRRAAPPPRRRAPPGDAPHPAPRRRRLPGLGRGGAASRARRPAARDRRAAR